MNGIYTDEEGRKYRLEKIKPCTVLKDWVHAVMICERFEGGEWVEKRNKVTICAWGNNGLKYDEPQSKK